MSDRLLGPDELETELRAIGAERYHHLHPFHRLLLQRVPNSSLLGLGFASPSADPTAR
jgi:hypothetical protein